jgi:hypothetical protein
MAGDLPDWTTQLASGAVLLGKLYPTFSLSSVAELLLDPVPAGVTGISVLVLNSFASGDEVVSVQAVGQTSGIDYIVGQGTKSLALLVGAEYVGTVPGQAEPVLVSVSFQVPAADTVLVGLVVGWLGNTLVHPQNDPQQPLYTQGPTAQAGQGGHATDAIVTGPYAYDWQGGVGGAPAADIDMVVAGLRALLQNGAAAPTFDELVGGIYGQSGKSVQVLPETPHYRGNVNSASMASGTSATLLGTPPSGTSWRLRKFHLNVNQVVSVGVLAVIDSSGEQFMNIEASGSDVGPWNFDFEGMAATAGASVEIKNTGNATLSRVSAVLTADAY